MTRDDTFKGFMTCFQNCYLNLSKAKKTCSWWAAHSEMLYPRYRILPFLLEGALFITVHYLSVIHLFCSHNQHIIFNSPCAKFNSNCVRTISHNCKTKQCHESNEHRGQLTGQHTQVTDVSHTGNLNTSHTGNLSYTQVTSVTYRYLRCHTQMTYVQHTGNLNVTHR